MKLLESYAPYVIISSIHVWGDMEKFIFNIVGWNKGCDTM